jgi:RNA methyltransferase, TrmH family
VAARITSTTNERLKRIRALRTRKERERAGLAYVEGIRAVGEAVQLRADIETLIVAPDLLRSDFALNLVQQARADGVDVLELSGGAFETISQREGPQGLAAIVRQRWDSLALVRPRGGDCWVALAGVQDPGNLGTILRTAEATGAPGVILLDSSVDAYDPSAMRASTGAIFSRRLVRTTSEGFAPWLRERNVAVVGTSDAATASYRDLAYPAPMVLLMGSERAGLTHEQRALCGEVVRIPMAGRVDSLNLAVATGIVLYEVFHQRTQAATQAAG